mmetsp:Transcript_19835/g.32811  ORF Transcript_19835/g.32811 Transcript_19835/m.32811 type:complete len:139 (-) Transcript_19835:216-632(-)
MYPFSVVTTHSLDIFHTIFTIRITIDETLIDQYFIMNKLFFGIHNTSERTCIHKQQQKQHRKEQVCKAPSHPQHSTDLNRAICLKSFSNHNLPKQRPKQRKETKPTKCVKLLHLYEQPIAWLDVLIHLRVEEAIAGTC